MHHLHSSCARFIRAIPRRNVFLIHSGDVAAQLHCGLAFIGVVGTSGLIIKPALRGNVSTASLGCYLKGHIIDILSQRLVFGSPCNRGL